MRNILYIKTIYMVPPTKNVHITSTGRTTLNQHGLYQKETRSFLQVSSVRESNSHRLTPTTPSKWRVYHFTTSAFGLGLQRYIDFI